MNIAAPHLAVLSPAGGGVLAILAGADRPLGRREVARIGGQPKSTAARVLRWSVPASLAVLAGIAASDAACCSALGRH